MSIAALIRGKNAIKTVKGAQSPQLSQAQTERRIASYRGIINGLDQLFITGSKIISLSSNDIEKMAVVDIDGTIAESKNSILLGTVNDPRLGSTGRTPCVECGEIGCNGHYARILIDPRRGQRPEGDVIINPVFTAHLIDTLSCLCRDCGAFLVSREVAQEKGITKLPHKERLKRMKELSKGIECFHGEMKANRLGLNAQSCGFPIEYSLEKTLETGMIIYYKLEKGKKASDRNKSEQLRIDFRRAKDLLDPNNISYKDAEDLLGFRFDSHPSHFLLNAVPVPPIIARPPNHTGAYVSPDKMTEYLRTICALAQKYTIDKDIKTKQKGGQTKQVISTNTSIFLKYKEMLDGKGTIQDYLSVLDRIQGKEGLLRSNSMGKRNNYCARTVASPDPSLEFGAISIPQIWAGVTTKTETVAHFNVKRLTKLLEEGKIVSIFSKRDQVFKRVKDVRRLYLGDTVYRFMMNGDYTAVNRQPTLHRESMMGYQVDLKPQLTIGAHLSYTTPMNLDFDGDELNLWIGQSVLVDAEMKFIMNVKENILGRAFKPEMGMTMNGNTAPYILSDPNCMIDDYLFEVLIRMISTKDELETLGKRLERYRVHPRSGIALISALLPPNLTCKHSRYEIIEGVLISGRLGKASLGTANRSVIQEIVKQYGNERASIFFSDAPRVFNKWIMERGFSVGLPDIINIKYDPETGVEVDENAKAMKPKLDKAFLDIMNLGPKRANVFEERVRINKIKKYSDAASGAGTLLTKEVLSEDNSIAIMADSDKAGTKGSIPNIAQIMGFVGQQFYRGNRLQRTITDGQRALPIFDENDLNPKADGFIGESFFTGLTPEGLFFLMEGGREGLMDTAMKTSETGDLQHKMAKALESILCVYDGSVRNTVGTLFSPIYGCGFATEKLFPIEVNKEDSSFFIDVLAEVRKLNINEGWVPHDVYETIEKRAPVNVSEDDVIPHSKDVPEIQSKPIKKGTDYYKITKFEKARLIGTRATQIENNAKPLISYQETDLSLEIATKEYEQGLLASINLYVVRKKPSGVYVKIYPTMDNI